MNSRLAEIQIMLRVGAGACAAAAAALLYSAMPAPPAAAASSSPGVVVSPLPGTPDADPHTQISFLGAPSSELRDVVVRGSETGSHAGALHSYSTGDGGSFVPATRFADGEQVTVSATVVSGGGSTRIGTSFRVGHPYRLPPPSPVKPIPKTRRNVMRFHSRHGLVPPAVTIAKQASNAALGDVFITPNAGPGQAGPMIVAPSGALVWFDPLAPGTLAFDLKVQSYKGRPVLTWWQGAVVGGHGQGEDVIEGADYTPVATVRAGNGLDADLHDFELTPRGTAWITAYEPEHWDLSANGGLHRSLIDDGVVQEIDVKTGLVMFEWHALGHVAVSATYMRVPRYATTVLDYFHLNSVEPVADGDLLISSRNTWATYLISATTGAIAWRLGGKNSSFSLGSGVHFAWQHDAELQPDGTLSLFDNEAWPNEASQSRAVDIALDDTKHTASLVHEFTYPGAGILSESQGDTQLLSNGDVLVGWGQVGEATEFAPNGAVTFDLRLASPTGSYRAFRFPWHAQPDTPPALRAAKPGRKLTGLWASWNGATEVARWRVIAGSSPTHLATVGTYPSRGFETAIIVPTTAPYVRVAALSANGAVLASSAVVHT
jgi:hypothetical protein